MSNLEDTVRSVVSDFITRGVLFTALDVSNAVKQTLPLSKHREIREVVRNIYVSEIETQNWSRTAITVNLADGSTAEAWLYHPLAESWDLDNKYNAQQRSATSLRPTTQASVVFTPSGDIHVNSAAMLTLTSTPTTPPVVTPPTTAVDLWNTLLQTQPSLFPVK